jgi:DNA-binding MarR family transcriptional regulator
MDSKNKGAVVVHDKEEDSAEFSLATELDETLSRLTHEIKYLMRSQARGEMTVSQLQILARLYQDPCTITDLASHQGVSPPAMSKMVDVLEKKLWVERVTDPKDRRHVGVQLTAEGKKQFMGLGKKSRIQVAEQFRKISDSEKAIVAKALKILSEFYKR